MTKTNKILSLAALMAIATACKKEPIPDVATPKQTSAMAPNDPVPRAPMYLDTAEPKPALTGFELVDLTIDWGRVGLIDPDSLHDICIDNRYTDVVIKTPSDIYENSALYFSLPGGVHRARDTLDVKMNELENYGKNARGYGKIYVARHDLPNIYEIQPGWNPCGMSGEDYDWFTMNGWTVVDTNLLSKNYKPFDTVAQWNHKSQLDSIRPALYTKQTRQFDTAKYNRRRQNLYRAR